MSQDLARRVDEAQSILGGETAQQAALFERAYASCNAEAAVAMAKLDPLSAASALPVAGGYAIYAGLGSPLTQALGIGYYGKVTATELDAIEAHLAPKGPHATQLEVSPFVDPSLNELLATRGYRVQEWELVWTRPLDAMPIDPARAPHPRLEVRPMRMGEEDTYLRVMAKGFLESEDVPAEAVEMMRGTVHAESSKPFLAWLGDEPIGGAGFARCNEVAFMKGCAVRPGFRNHGAQGALLRARLAYGARIGCTVAYSCTQPGTASRRNMERHGFQVAYPKIVMLRAV